MGTNLPLKHMLQCSRCLLMPKSLQIKLLKKLWELQAIPEEDSPLTSDEQSAVAQYKNSYTRLPSGQYSVSLPRCSSVPELGTSRSTALCRFLQNKRSLTHKGQWDTFNTGLEEYVILDHAELVPPGVLDKPVSLHFISLCMW